MMIISGKDISLKIKDQLKLEVEEIKKRYPRLPKLTVILVGDNQASQTYVTVSYTHLTLPTKA